MPVLVMKALGEFQVIL